MIYVIVPGQLPLPVDDNYLCRIGSRNCRRTRHTWASWHVQNGTSLHELQQLGGWSEYDTVLRYAHLSSDHLRKASERVSGTFTSPRLGS